MKTLEERVADLEEAMRTRPSKRFVYDAVRNILVNELAVTRTALLAIVELRAREWLFEWANGFTTKIKLDGIIGGLIRVHLAQVLKDRVSVTINAGVEVKA